MKEHTKARLNLRIDRDLLDWTKSYVESNRTTISHIVRQLFRQLRETEEAKKRVYDVEQIS